MFSLIAINASLIQGGVFVGADVRYGFGVEYAPVAFAGFSGRIGYETDMFVINDGYNSDSESYTLGSFYAAVAYKF